MYYDGYYYIPSDSKYAEFDANVYGLATARHRQWQNNFSDI